MDKVHVDWEKGEGNTAVQMWLRIKRTAGGCMCQ